jgi:hypothetical protein
MTKVVTIFWCKEDKGWAWETRNDEAAIDDLGDLADCLLEECRGAKTQLVVIDKQGKAHKGPAALKALPRFGGRKPPVKNAVSWDEEDIITHNAGKFAFVERQRA